MNIKFKNSVLLLVLFISIFSLFLPTYSQQGAPMDIFIKRHSGKAFDPILNLNLDQYRALIEASRWAPSSHNDQPWNFIFCDRDLTPESYFKVFNCLKETQQQWIQNVPVLAIVVARTKEIYKGKFNEWADYDVGAAAISMSLQAADLGLMAHQIGGFDKAKISQEFQLPEDHKILTIIAIGYEAAEGEPDAQPRTRRPIHENFFLGEWGQGFNFPEDQSGASGLANFSDPAGMSLSS